MHCFQHLRRDDRLTRNMSLKSIPSSNLVNHTQGVQLPSPIDPKVFQTRTLSPETMILGARTVHFEAESHMCVLMNNAQTRERLDKLKHGMFLISFVAQFADCSNREELDDEAWHDVIRDLAIARM